MGRIHGNWQHQHRDGGEYQSHIHFTPFDGHFFTVDFNRTGVMMVGNGMGEIDSSLDGKHELKGVKIGGSRLQVDMFRVYIPAGGNRKNPGPNNSIHSTDRHEDFVHFDFNGTARSNPRPQGPERGTIEVSLAGQSVRRINQYHGKPKSNSPLVSLTNLTPGRHTLYLVKKRGKFMDAEAFRVFQQDF